MVNVSAPVLATKLFCAAPREKSRKTSSAMMAIWFAEHIWLSCAISSGLVKWPVGIIGMDDDDPPSTRRDGLL